MKKSISLLALLLFLSASLFAQKTEYIRKKNEDLFLLKNRLEKPDKNAAKEKRIPHFRDMITKKQNHSLKSTDVIKQRLDSITGGYWDDYSSQWLPESKDEFTYDDNGNNTKLIECEWEPDDNRWIPYDKQEYSYDAEGRIIEYLDYEWDDATSQWESFWKSSFTYDVNGNMIQLVDYYWSDYLNNWTFDTKTDMTYDAAGNLVQDIEYFWDEDITQWINSTKGEYTYNTGNNIILEIFCDWDENSSAWVNFCKTEYSYDTGDKLILILDYQWNTTGWIASNKMDYTWDLNGHVVQEVFSSWDESSSLWVYAFKSEHIYDSDGNLTQELSYLWEQSVSQWVAESKDEYEYNNSFSFSNLLLPFLFLYDGEDVLAYFNHMLTHINNYVWEDNQWIFNYKTVLDYSPQEVLSINSISAGSNQVSPNPVSDYLTVTLDKNYDKARFELFDMQGKKVLSENVMNHEKVSLQGFSAGIYYYVIIAGQERQSGKLIKE